MDCECKGCNIIKNNEGNLSGIVEIIRRSIKGNMEIKRNYNGICYDMTINTDRVLDKNIIYIWCDNNINNISNVYDTKYGFLKFPFKLTNDVFNVIIPLKEDVYMNHLLA